MRGSITIRQRREAGLEVEQITKVPLVFYGEDEEDMSGSNADYMWTVASMENIEIAFTNAGTAMNALSAALRALGKLFPEDARERERMDLDFRANGPRRREEDGSYN